MPSVSLNRLYWRIPCGTKENSRSAPDVPRRSANGYVLVVGTRKMCDLSHSAVCVPKPVPVHALSSPRNVVVVDVPVPSPDAVRIFLTSRNAVSVPVPDPVAVRGAT